MLKKLIARGSFDRVHSKQTFDNVAEFSRIVLWKLWIGAREDTIIETLHVFGSEWWVKRAHFIDDATEGPNITLIIIRLLLPYFWTCIIRSACLSIKQSILSNLTHV